MNPQLLPIGVQSRSGLRQDRPALEAARDGRGPSWVPNDWRVNSALALAGDFIFVGMVKPEGGSNRVHILKRDDGAYVGTFVPGSEVGGNPGWEDMPYAAQALKLKNGGYLVLVEEDWRGKNLLYRWTP